jgi:hypothetical protein
VNELITIEDCLSRAQEYISLAQDTEDATLRSQYLLLAKELTELAGILDRKARREGG